MINEGIKALAVPIIVAILAACAPQQDRSSSTGVLPSCQIIYDAGSSKTRLYIYERSATGWVKHHGPRTDALADPVRAIRGKTMDDLEIVVDALVGALEDIRRDGPVTKSGQPQWPAFDWRTACRIDAVAVYATAGMRLAEQQDAAGSHLLWRMLNGRLGAATKMEVTTRTISGFEEGLFAWLAIHEGQAEEKFGVAEMGGASVQITFPCDSCEASRPVMVNGQLVPIYSHSLLGWGQDVAWRKHASIADCKPGIGLVNPDWQINDCASEMELSSDRSEEIRASVVNRADLNWYLAGAFRHMQDSDIDQFCRGAAKSGFKPKSSCFRAVYLQHVLNTLGLPQDYLKANMDWTLGAVVCTATRCLDNQ